MSRAKWQPPPRRRFELTALGYSALAQARINKFYEYSMLRKPLLDVDVVLSELSTSLREELAGKLYAQYQVGRIAFDFIIPLLSTRF